MIKKILPLILALTILSCPSKGQNTKNYDFINFIIKNDSSLIYMKFNPKKGYLHDVCDLVEGAILKIADPFRDSSFLKIATDTSITSEIWWEAFKNAEERCKEKIINLVGSDSLCLINKILIQKQVEENNRKRKHKIKYISATKNFLRIQTRKSYGYYTLSNPIFIKSNKIVLIKKYYHFGPLYGRGYFEIYKEVAQKKWKRIVQYLYIMS